MEPIENKNIEAVKRFIEVQIRPGEKYDYEVIRKRLKAGLTLKENSSLRNYGLILDKLNKGYQGMVLGKIYDVSDWYIDKLREFVVKYRQLHPKTSPLPANNRPKIEWHFLPKKQIKEPPRVSVGTNKIYPPIAQGTTHVELDNIGGTKITRGTVNVNPNFSYFESDSRRSRWGSGPRIKMRGHYSSQKFPVDEFGCVVVCSSNDE